MKEIEKFRAVRSEINEVVFINDGSSDNTKTLVLELTANLHGYVLLSFSRNFGHQMAVTAGLDIAKGNAAIIMDADLQDPLHVAGQMIDKWKNGFDVVYGIRDSREGETWFKRKTAKLFYRFFKWLTDLEIPLDTGDFRLISRPVIDAYKQLNEQQPFIRGLISWLGFNQKGIHYHREKRKAGKTKYPLAKMIKLASHAVTSFSDKPLRIATHLGLSVSFLAVIGIIWVFYARLILDTAVPGWASSLVIILFLGGVQMMFLGLIGVYLSRIYAEVKQRPRYVTDGIWRTEAKNSGSSNG
ncbi:MAG: glycosyltransferase family 2 protein [Balneolaceae bacterium]|nr:glycosyltransferase family 2 protein [Balneolaceae bacterium]